MTDIETNGSDESEICPVCLEKPQAPIVLPCDHKFCYLCIKGSMRFGNSKCPACRCTVPSKFLEDAQAAIDIADIDTSVPRWVYSGRSSGWWFYQNDHNSIIEDAWENFIKSRTTSNFDKDAPPTCEIMVSSKKYTIDFVTMTQTSSTGVSRNVRRISCADLKSSKGVAGVRYMSKDQLPKYQKEYPDVKDDKFNPHYADSYVIENSSEFEDSEDDGR